MAVEPASITGILEITTESEPHTGWAHGMRTPVSEAELTRRGYRATECVIEGTVDGGGYRTTLLVRMPVDPDRFSGLVLLETLHSRGHCTIWPSAWDYLVAGGHGYALVVSQKESLDRYLASARPDRYASMSIPSPSQPGRGTAGLPPGLITGSNGEESIRAMIESTPNSLAILSQVGALLKAGSTLFDVPARQLAMAGMSQTGGQTIAFIEDAHQSATLDDGRFVYDGFLPLASFGSAPIRPSGVPIVHVVNEAEILPPLTHRRPDGDEESDLYRLYELPGSPHVPTRGMTKDDAAAFFASLPGGPGPTGVPDLAESDLSQYPSSLAYRAILAIFVEWLVRGVVPPHAPPIQTAGDHVVRDQHGNALGGVRHSYLEVPTASYLGTFVGFQEPFDCSMLRRLHGDEASYLAQVERSLQRLVAERFLLLVHAAELLDEAKSVRFDSVTR